MGPSYANLFVGFIEHQFFSQYHGPKPELYGRYIDDCIGATSSTKEELTQFIAAVNSFYPALKYTWEISDTSLAFLDIKFSIEGNSLWVSGCVAPLPCRPRLRRPNRSYVAPTSELCRPNIKVASPKRVTSLIK